MLDKINLLLLLAVTSTNLRAQQNVFERQICERRTAAELSTITDSARETSCVFVFTADSITALVFNNKMEPLKTFSVMRQPDEQPLGGSVSNGIAYYFFSHGNETVHTVMFNYKTGVVNDKYQYTAMLKERMIAQISNGKHFLYCTINKKASDFAVYDFIDSSCNTIRYSSGNIWNDFTKNGHFVGRDIDVAAVTAEGDCSVEAARSLNKIYAAGDSMYVLSNTQKGVTNIYSVNLAAKSIGYREVSHNNLKNQIRHIEFIDNSFMFQNKLYYVWANNERFGIQVRDFFSGKILKLFDAEKNEDITFNNTPIIEQNSKLLFAKQTHEVNNAAKLLPSKMASCGAVITATQSDSGRIAILVGSYKENTSYSGGGMWSTQGAYIPTGSFYRNGQVTSTRFKMLVNHANQQVAGEIPNSINEKIETYTEKEKIAAREENLIKIKDSFYYVYYRKKDGRLAIIKW